MSFVELFIVGFSFTMLRGLSLCHADPLGSAQHVIFGFNTKGTVSVAQQTAWTDELLSKFPPEMRKRMVIRVTAGTWSQISYEKDWTAQVLGCWAALQKKHGVRYIYVVNGNDTPSNQATNIQRWMDAGNRFDFLEMMNEYYLPKFAKGDTNFEEVTRSVSPEAYTEEILPAYWTELDRFQLPYAIICAPTRSKFPDAHKRMIEWNDIVINSVFRKHPERTLIATIHLYTDKVAIENGYDYDQVERLRRQLPAGVPIAVTEAGVQERSIDYDEAGSLSIEFYKRLLPHLQPGDYLLDQILYNEGHNNNTAFLNPDFKGLTPKARKMIPFLRDTFQKK